MNGFLRRENREEPVNREFISPDCDRAFSAKEELESYRKRSLYRMVYHRYSFDFFKSSADKDTQETHHPSILI